MPKSLSRNLTASGAACVFVAMACVAAPTYGAENVRLEKLYSMFMAPCCWQQNLHVHQSPVADQLRRQIQTMVQDGRTDEEIKTTFVGQYTKRILAIPEGPEALWLFLIPGVAMTAGLVFVLVQIRRWRTRVIHPFRFPQPVEFDPEWEEPAS